MQVCWCADLNYLILAGETIFYNSNILHCATYSSKAPRVTLHACIGDTRGGSSRARNVLQHGLGWMKDDAFREGLNTRGQDMLARLIEMQETFDGKLEYSLANWNLYIYLSYVNLNGIVACRDLYPQAPSFENLQVHMEPARNLNLSERVIIRGSYVVKNLLAMLVPGHLIMNQFERIVSLQCDSEYNTVPAPA